MRNFFSIIILICSSAVFAQKVKVKKDKILIDGSEVGIIEVLDKSEIKYVVKDLGGDELLEVDVDIANGSTRPFEFNWMTITSKNYSQVNVVDYSMLSMSLSHAKIIAEILVKTHGMFTLDGVNEKKITEFFSEERTSKFKEDATGSRGADMAGLGDGFTGKVRVKDNQVLFDKVAVANVIANKGVYTFSSLKDKTTLKVDFYVAELADTGEILKWIAVSDSNRKSELKMEYLSGNTKDANALAELLAEKYNIITQNGIENLDTFFSVERKNLTEEYRVKFNKAKESFLKAEGLIKFKIEEENLRIKNVISDIDRGLILSKDGAKPLGRIETLKGVNMKALNFYVNIIDNNDEQIARITSMPDSESKEFFLVGYDNKRHLVNITGDVQFSRSVFYRSLSQVLVENGYANAIEFGVERAKEIAVEEYFVKTKEAGNLRYAPGYMFVNLKKGIKRLEGYVTVYFKPIPIPEGVQDIEKGRIMNTNVDGKRLGKVFRFQTTKSIEKGILHKARDNKGFCIYLEGSKEKCYVGKKLGTANYGFVEVDTIAIAD